MSIEIFLIKCFATHNPGLATGGKSAQFAIDFYVTEFRTKCESKAIDPTEFHNKLEQRLPQYKGRWQSSMADQIQDLPDFEEVLREVTRHIKKF